MSDFPERELAFQTVAAGDTAALLALLQKEPTIRNATNAEGISLLMFAIYNRKRDVANLLVQLGVELDVFSASAYGALKLVTEILSNGPALVNAISPDGWTPLHLASFFGNILVVKYLVMSGGDINAVSRNNLKNQPLNAATASNHTDIAKFLIQNGADVNFAQHGGVTPLHEAAHNGNDELVQIFLSHGAIAAAKDEAGETALDKATKQGHTNVMAILQSS